MKVALSDTSPPPGMLVPVNRSHLHLQCIGDGRPTVVLEPGMFGLGLVWSAVQSGVARFTRVCSYDHLGTGWSGPRPGAPTADMLTGNLHIALHTAAVPGPYVLVGWSWGGHYARLFAGHYPDEVAGMVLVDASHEEMLTRFPPVLRRTTRVSGVIFRVLRTLAWLRVLRLHPLLRAVASLLPPVAPEVQPLLTAHLARPETWATLVAQTQLHDEYLVEVRRAGSLGDRPLVVITAGATWERPNRMPPGIKPGELTPIWHELQSDLARLSSRATHRIVAEATHANIATAHAGVVVDAIRQVVEAVRHG